MRIFIVDDHALFRDALHVVLEMADNIEVIGSAGSAHEATLAIPAVRPGVVLMDVRLGDGNGIDVCRDVCAADRSARVLMLATLDDHPRDMGAAIIAGAAGYMLKQVDRHGLVDAFTGLPLARGCSGSTPTDVEWTDLGRSGHDHLPVVRGPAVGLPRVLVASTDRVLGVELPEPWVPTAIA